jgi:hypothetical protein
MEIDWGVFAVSRRTAVDRVVHDRRGEDFRRREDGEERVFEAEAGVGRGELTVTFSIENDQNCRVVLVTRHEENCSSFETRRP